MATLPFYTIIECRTSGIYTLPLLPLLPFSVKGAGSAASRRVYRSRSGQYCCTEADSNADAPGFNQLACASMRLSRCQCAMSDGWFTMWKMKVWCSLGEGRAAIKLSSPHSRLYGEPLRPYKGSTAQNALTGHGSVFCAHSCKAT